MRSRFTRKSNGYNPSRRFTADKVVVKVKDTADSEYRIVGRYTDAKFANEIATELKDCCYDVIVEY